MKLKEIREDLGISQKRLAELLNVSPSNVYNYENGRTEPSTEMLRNISRCLNVSVDYLIGNEDVVSSVKESYESQTTLNQKNITEEAMSFKDKIKELRMENNLTQKKLAEALSLSQSCITKLEAGTREPTGSTLSAYSQFFNVSVDYLIGNEDVATSIEESYESQMTLSEKEKELIRVYRSLSDNGKNTLLGSAHNIERFDPQVSAVKKA